MSGGRQGTEGDGELIGCALGDWQQWRQGKLQSTNTLYSVTSHFLILVLCAQTLVLLSGQDIDRILHFFLQTDGGRTQSKTAKVRTDVTKTE